MEIIKVMVDGVEQDFVSGLEEGEKEVNNNFYDNSDTIDLKDVIESVKNSGDFNE